VCYSLFRYFHIFQCRSNPLICQSQDKDGHSPIYVAILLAKDRPNAWLADVILTLISFNPKLCGSCHDLSLHILLQKKYPANVLLALIRADPKICRYADKAGHLPLLISIEMNVNSDAVIAILHAFPDACTHYDMYFPQRKIPPLHAALRRRCSHDIIREIVTKCPSSCMKKDHSGRLPLHLAIMKNTRDDDILALIRANASACAVPDMDGSVPLALAIAHAKSYEVIDELLKAYPKGIKCHDNEGYFPLHVAVKVHPSVTVIKRLISMCPEVCLKPVACCNSYLPIHMALSVYRRPTEIIHELIIAAPETCKVKVGA